MTALIKMMGHDCRFAINGFAALEIAREFRPEVVLLDIGVPGLTGDEIARQLKWEPGFERTRFVAITALPIEAVRARALSAGCEQVFAKPIDPAKLEELLQQAQA
jgi:CheY-like chemotaxis protein